MIEEKAYRRFTKADKQGNAISIVVRRFTPHPEAGVVPIIEKFEKLSYWKNGNWRTLDGHLVPYEKKDILGAPISAV